MRKSNILCYNVNIKMAKKTTKTTTAKNSSAKASSKKSLSSHHENEQDLYVCVLDVVNKRRSLLSALKTALLAQEECEVVTKLRRQRYQHIDALKKELAHINSLYVRLQKLFPNVKNILTHTEKEVNELHSQITVLATSQRVDKKELDDLRHLTHSLEKSEEGLGSIQERVEEITTRSSELEEKEVSSKKPLNKLDRIKNNLSIIESKLKDL